MCEYTANTRAKCADTREYIANTQDTCISRVFELVLSVSRVYQLKYLDTCIIRVFKLYLLHLKQIHVSGRTDTRYMYSKVCSDVSDMY